MKKVLHLFRVEKFTAEFIKFVNTNFREQSHTFWVHGDKFLDEGYEYLEYGNVEYCPNIEIKLNKIGVQKQLEEFDLIIYHWVIDFPVIDFFYRHKKLLKKLALYFWGGDKNLFGDWKDKVKKKYIINHAGALITIIPQEYEEITAQYHYKGKLFRAMYGDTSNQEMIKDLLILGKEEGSTINIQIGNSAYPEFNHISVLRLLSKFKGENIKIFAPLSYGIMSYAEEVIQFGKELFGEKFIPLQHFIPKKEYYNLLQNMDIAIMDMEKQHALGNIFILMQLGCTVYFRRSGMLYKFFSEDLQCRVAFLSEIENMHNIEELLKLNYKEKQYNRKQICEWLSIDNLSDYWEKIFNAF